MRKKTNSLFSSLLTRKFVFLFAPLLLVAVWGYAALRQPKAKAASRAVPQASDALWQDVNRTSIPNYESIGATVPRTARTLRLNRTTLSRTLTKAPLKLKEQTHETLLSLPLPDGGFAQFRLEASPVLPAPLAAKFPALQSYRGEAVGLTATMRCDWSPRGFHATILQGNRLISIHPASAETVEHYVSYYNTAQRREAEQLFCLVKDDLRRQEAVPTAVPAALTSGAVLRTYRIAIATTQEYTNAATLGGGTVANTMASLTTFLNAVNVIYERELAIHFVLAQDNDKAIYTSEPDPFTNGDANQMLTQVNAALKDKVGESKYDLGHVLGTGGGGVAGLGVVCQANNKSLGVSLMSPSEPVGAGFGLQTLLHEIGHQFSATHTFSASCDNNRSDATAYESASGLTIMSYAGACNPSIVSSAAPHFHSASISQILEFIGDETTGGSCGLTAPTGNNTPSLNPGIAFTIPNQTPFVLTATGSDADASDFANLTYSWEQVDAGATPPYANASGPLFRPFNPTSSPTRYFPSLTYILNNANVPPATVGGLETAENLPTAGRAMNFNSIVRDNRGGVAIEPIMITAADSGPFVVTQPSIAVSWTGGTTQTVSWSVNGTNAAPVNCQTVRLTLSTDGGQTFPYELSNDAPNNGSANVTIPLGLYSTKARVKVEAVGNIFFDVSDTNFTVLPGDGCAAISGINPLIGTTGTAITITGLGFTGVTGVTFSSGVDASFTVDSDTQITTSVPSGANSGFITISKTGCEAKQTPYFTISTGLAFTRRVDDGTIESSLSEIGTGPAYYVNRISPQTYPATVRAITLFIPDSVPVGTDLTMLVGTNPSGGASINGTTFQTASYKTTGNNQFFTVLVPNVSVASGDVVVGFSHVPQTDVYPAAVDLDDPIQNRSYLSTDGGANYVLVTNANFVIRALFSPGAICSGSGCTPSGGNTPPTVIPAAALTRSQGAIGSITQLATISDLESAIETLTVTATSIPEGLTLSNLTNTNGIVTARIDSSCTAPSGLKVITLNVSDGEQSSTLNFIVNVPPNTAPILADYDNVNVASAGNATVIPAAPPSDNGSITTLNVSSSSFSGSLFINRTTGAVTINNAGLVGTHTVFVNATDNCGASSSTNFQITVVPQLTISSLSPSAIQAKSNGFNLTVNGNGFTNSSVVRWNGADRTTNFDSTSKLIAAIPASDINLDTAGNASVTVFDTATGLSSNTLGFTITAPNPAPAITSLNPTSVIAGGAAFTLTVNGTNFINSSQVRFNGNNRTTTVVSATQLTAALTAADIASAGSAAITVVNPAPGGGTSNTVNLPINNPAPGALTLNPASIVAGSGTTMVTVTGTNFRAGSIVRVNGADRTTTFVSATELKANLTANDVLTASILKLTVFTPTPGGGTSPEANFTVNNPAPTLTTLSPASAMAGGTDFTLTITGTNFISTSQVKFNGADRATTFVSATQLTINVAAADIASAGTAAISVVNPAPGGGTSNPLHLPINNPAPTLTSLNPNSALIGSGSTTVTLMGASFRTNSVVRVNGVDRATTFLSATQLRIGLSASELASSTTLKLSVFTPTPGGGASAELNFTVGNPVPAITTLNPAAVNAGSAAFTLTINGMNFVNGTQVKFNGADRTTTFVSATQLTIDVTAADIAAPGLATVVVGNPAPGGGTSNTVNLSINNATPGALTLNPNSTLVGSAAMTLSVAGSGFTNGSIIRVNGNDRATTFVTDAQLTTQLTVADLANAGTLKITVNTPPPGGGLSPEASFTVNNPAPNLASLNPAAVLAGGAAFTLTINGTGFIATSQVKVNGADRTTTFVSTTQLTIALTAADIANPGTLNVTIVNAAPGGGTSNPLGLLINNPVPMLTSLNPASVLVGSAATTVTLTGADFRPNSIVKVNGADRATTFVSATQLQTNLTTGDLSSAAILKLSVFTPTPGGGTSAELDFTVGNVVPTITTLNPAVAIAGGADFTLAINGTNFINGSKVKFNGADRVTTFVSATQLTIAVAAADISATGSATVTVVNPAPGGGTSNTVNLPINNPVPGALTLAPNAIVAGSGAIVVTVTGTNFRAASIVKVNGSDRPTTFVSTSELKANLTANDVLNASVLKFMVFTPEPGGGTSPEANFTVNNPTPSLTSLTPATATAGGADFTLTIVGANLVNGAQVKFNGADRATTFVSATQLTINVAAADLANAGAATITVVNPAPGGGVSNQLNLPINNPSPLLTSLNPATVVMGSPATNVTLMGNHFRPNSIVKVNGADRTTSFVSATQLQMMLTAADLTNATILKLSVLTPTPGGGTSEELNFIVGNPIPTITTLTPASVIVGSSTLTLAINGSNFLNSSQVKFNGADRTTTFVSATQLTIEVTAADVASTGTATIAVVNPAPGGGTSNAVNLPINNPAPGAITLSPATAIVGSSGFSLTINGSNFRANSIVRVNDADRATSFISATQLRIQLTTADLANVGTLKITVNTPPPGGGVSPEAGFTINNPAPTLTSLNPSTATAGGSTFFLTLNGTGFLSSTIVKFNGTDRAATLVNSTQMTITVSASDLANAGAAKIVAVNPTPGGGTSNELTLPINNPVPGALTLAPSVVIAGSGTVMVTVTGTNFRANSVVRANGANRMTTFVSASELKVSLPESDVAAAGTLKLTVFTPEPGGGTSPEAPFTINNPAPTLAGLNPTSAAKGDPGLMLTVTGTNFVNGSIVRWNGADRVTTFVSATQLKAAILDSDLANEGSANISVFTPTPGGGTSSNLSFTIRPPGFEADVAPRPNGTGNGTVTIADWTQVGRFVAGLDAVTNGNEFQRADVAPRASLGDGRITIADWVQAGRYAAGLDPVTGTGGPTQPSAALASEFSIESGPRVLRALNGNWLRGQLNSLRIELDAQGNENALSFSLEYDPHLLSFYGATAENGAIVTINQRLAGQGRLGLMIALPAGQQFAAGTHTALQVQFVPKGGVDTVTTFIRFSDQIIRRDLADAFANSLTGTTFIQSELTISGRATAHVSAASYLGNEAAADSMVSAFGVELATVTASAVESPLPSLLGGTRVMVKDSAGIERAASLFFVSPTQINYLVPADTAIGLAHITITNHTGFVSNGVINIVRTAAGLFSADATGNGLAAATLQRNRANGSVSYEAVTRFDSVSGQIVGVPIEFNDDDELFLVLYGTGLRHRSALGAINIRMGGIESEVLYAGAQGQYLGLDQINVRIPRELKGRGDVSVDFTVEDQPANQVKVVIR